MESPLLNKITDRHIILGLILCIFVMLLAMTFIIKNTKQCDANPFTYGVKKITPHDSELLCSCSFSNPRYAPFYFDKDNVSVSGLRK